MHEINNIFSLKQICVCVCACMQIFIGKSLPVIANMIVDIVFIIIILL